MYDLQRTCVFSIYVSTTFEPVRAEIVLCLGAETPVQATRLYNSEQCSKLDPVQKASVAYNLRWNLLQTQGIFRGDF